MGGILKGSEGAGMAVGVFGTVAFSGEPTLDSVV